MGMLHRRGHFSLDHQCRRTLPRIAVAAIGMGVSLVVAMSWAAPALDGAFAQRLSVLAGLIALGLATFAVLVLVLGAARWRDVLDRFRRKKD
jgi:putative peptidoglycan lipid II flippase